MNYYYDDFTTDNFIRLLLLAKGQYDFITYDKANKSANEAGSHILLRHDVDYSLNGAAKLARIEHEYGIISTFFVYAHSDGYNLQANDSAKMLSEIVAAGHDIGLHLDFSYCLLDTTENTISDLKKKVEQEIALIESLAGTKVKAISFHSPETNGVMNMSDEEVFGKINVCSESISNNYKYCSDSNGYWRFDRLEDVITMHEYNNLHILLHPIWWQYNEVLSPAVRVHQYFCDEAKKKWDTYVEFTIQSNRKVVGIEEL